MKDAISSHAPPHAMSARRAGSRRVSGSADVVILRRTHPCGGRGGGSSESPRARRRIALPPLAPDMCFSTDVRWSGASSASHPAAILAMSLAVAPPSREDPTGASRGDER